MEWRIMTPRERKIERAKDYGMAFAIGIILAAILLEGLTR